MSIPRLNTSHVNSNPGTIPQCPYHKQAATECGYDLLTTEMNKRDKRLSRDRLVRLATIGINYGTSSPGTHFTPKEHKLGLACVRHFLAAEYYPDNCSSPIRCFPEAYTEALKNWGIHRNRDAPDLFFLRPSYFIMSLGDGYKKYVTKKLKTYFNITKDKGGELKNPAQSLQEEGIVEPNPRIISNNGAEPNRECLPPRKSVLFKTLKILGHAPANVILGITAFVVGVICFLLQIPYFMVLFCIVSFTTR